MAAESPLTVCSPGPSLGPRSKPKGLPGLGEQLEQSDDEGGISLGKTPFRLPKRGKVDKEEESSKVWSRYGYECHTARSVDLGLKTSKMAVPPKLFSHELKRHQAAYPQFQRAMISPAPSSHRRMYAGDFDDPAFYRSLITTRSMPEMTDFVQRSPTADSLLYRSRFNAEYHLPEVDPSPTPIVSRSVSPAKSVKSIHWALSPYKHDNFDTKGRGRKSGPFSREFTVRCMAPTNWMRMKWGRSRTTLV